jgi:tetratricopeptide (TPR) repeat protein
MRSFTNTLKQGKTLGHHRKIYSWLVAFSLVSGIAGPAFAGNDAAETVPPAINMKLARGFTGSYLSGQFAKSSGDLSGAIRHLRRAHKTAPGDIGISSQLMGLLLLEGKAEEAIALADDMSKAGSKDPVAILLLSLREIKRDKVSEAAAILDAAFESDSGQLWLPLVSAWLDIGQKTLAKPLTLEELSANVGRTSPIVNYHLALINSHAGFNEAASANFKAAIEDIENPPTRVMAALLQFHDRHPSETLKPLAEAYRKAHPESDLKSDMPAIRGAREGVAEVLFTMGSIMLGAEITQDAVLYLQMALYLQPDLTMAAFTLGDAYSELRQYEKANATYARIDKSHPFYGRARLRMAVNYDQMGKLKEALELLDKMAKQSPEVVEALAAKGDLLRAHSRFPEAIEAYSQALQRIPELQSFHWPLFFARGVSFEREGKWELAEQDLKRALQLKADQPDVLNYLGYSWLSRGEHIAEARTMLEKAVKFRPSDAQIVDSMGWALYLLGEYDEAAEYLEKAVDLMPADPTVNDHLGDAYWRLGRRTEARYQWERSLTFSPETLLAETLRQKLKDGLPELASAADDVSSPVAHAMTYKPSDSAATE